MSPTRVLDPVASSASVPSRRTAMARRSVPVALVLLVASACGASAPPHRSGPDVVTAEWTSGDDAVLDTDADP